MRSLPLVLLIPVVFLLFYASRLDGVPVRAELSGPGVETPTLVLPARYFFVHLFDEAGAKIDRSLGKNAILVQFIRPPSGCHVSSYVHDAYDGSYNVRMVFHSSCPSVTLRVVSKDGRPLTDDILLRGPLEADSCNCPLPLDQWLSLARCARMELWSLIDESLATWPRRGIDLRHTFDEAMKKWSIHQRSYSLVLYKIRSNKIYKKTVGKYPGFSMFSDSVLLSITRKVLLPDMDLIWNLGDWPLESRRTASDPPLPVFSWCVSSDVHDIVLPTYTVTENTLKSNYSYNEDLLGVHGLRRIPWKLKETKAFWRGRDSREERLRLVNISKAYPDLLDANITRFFFFREVQHLYDTGAKDVLFETFFKYKYQVNVDGTVAAYRLPLLLAGNSVVLKQESDYREHFYAKLLPWKHYIPVKADLSDLVDQIRWAMNNEAAVIDIIKNAHAFLNANLMPREVFCYHVAAFSKYAERLKLPLDNELDGYEQIAQPEPLHPSACTCNRMEESKNEL